jgi:pyroglutamyl-peptidase
MKRAILTGFEPFGTYKYNPVQDTTREYNRKIIGGIEVIGLILPCTYYGAFELLSNKIDKLSPDIILGSGLASRVPCIRLETKGKNIMNGKYPDADEKSPKNELIINGDKLWYETTFNNKILADSLNNKGIKADISFDAESFICNSLIYLTARKIAKENLPIKFTFFHTPWTDDYLYKINIEPEKTIIKKSDLRKTIETIIEEIGKEQK